MLHDNPQFVAAVRKIIGESLSTKPTVDAEQAEQKSDDKRDDAPIVTVSELRTEKPIRIETEPEKSKAKRIWTVFGILEVFGILAVIVYTGLANRQWHEMISARHQTERALQEAQRASTAADIQFRRDQRPYIWVEPQGGTTDPNHPGQSVVMLIENSGVSFAARVEARNYGRSPAVNIEMTKTEYIIGPSEKAREEAKTYIPKFLPRANGFLVNNGPGFAPVSDVKKLTKAEYEAIMTVHTWDAYIVGAFRYRDIFSPKTDPPYETTYCFHLQPSGLPFSGCSFGSDYFGPSIK